jgi:FlaG/FlaF family flagellin (archaellin)
LPGIPACQVWALAFLRRAATLQALGRLRAASAAGSYPAHHALTPARVQKITREQQGSSDGTIYYGGYKPFVGAGLPLPDWATAEFAWDEELVISMFVGFDLRGNTLYSEFYPYVLPPVQASFHLVDRLPAQLTPGVLLLVARDAAAGLAGDVVSTVLGAPGRVLRWLGGHRGGVVDLEPVTDNSEFRLGRYAAAVVDRGARYSVRELAASAEFHHFFQEEDLAKYIKIVERQLFQLKGEFLLEHNVDLGDHTRNQTNIIDASSDNYNGLTINNSEGFSIGGRQVSHRSGAGQRERERRS